MRKQIAVVLRSYTCRPWTVAGAFLYFVVAAISVLAILSSNGPYTTTSIFDSRYDRIATLNHPAELPSWEADPSNQASTKAISIGNWRCSVASPTVCAAVEDRRENAPR